VRTLDPHPERACSRDLAGVDDDDLGRIADVRVNDVHDRGGAVLAKRLTEIERVEAAPLRVVGKAVRMRPHLHLAEQSLVRTAEDADPCRRSVAGEQQVVFRVDQYAGHSRQVR
jgi:hypothetical protein